MRSSFGDIFRSGRLVGDSIRRFKGYTTIGVLSITLVDLLDITLPLVLKAIIDAIEAGNRGLLIKFCLLYIGISTTQAVGRILWRVGFFQLGTKTARDIRARIQRTLLKLPLPYFSRRKTGSLVSLAQSDVEAVRGVLEHGMIVIFDGTLFLIVVPIVMFYLSPWLAFYSLLCLPVIPLMVVLYQKKLKVAAHSQQEAVAALSGFTHESFSTVRLIKSFAKEREFLARFSRSSQQVVERTVDLARREALFSPQIEGVISVAITVMLFLGSDLVLAEQISIGTFVAFQRYLQQLLWPTQAVGLWFSQLQRATASSERIEEVLKEEPDVHSTQSLPSSSGHSPLIKATHISFTYPGEVAPVIKDVSLSLSPGERVAIVGPTGGGKSTLLKLLLRTLSVSSGELLLHGENYDRLGIETVRASVSPVEQFPFLFSDTALANIAPYGNELEARQAARLAAIEAEIDMLPEKFQSVIGERGVTLSGGQKQRMAIARAMARQTPILLWDNALSSVDLLTEAKILESLKTLPHETAAIVVTHRLSTTLLMDRIIVLRNGVIEQQGTHQQLIQQRDGWYAAFCEHQKTLSALADLEGGVRE